jgi:hypothetical protein
MQRSTGIECLAILCLSGPAAEEMVCGPICDGGDREAGESPNAEPACCSKDLARANTSSN